MLQQIAWVDQSVTIFFVNIIASVGEVSLSGSYEIQSPAILQ